jgi:NAD(P)-dependent dehydrogenase (short-subunit alcohol dehydrogenase family)
MPLPQSPYCVITGAGGGFGRALAIELAGRGAHLALSDVDLKGVEETARLAKNAGARSVRSLLCDVTKIDDVKALAASCERPVDLVVNNAGVSSAGNVGEIPIEDWRWTIEVDLFGVINGCHVFVPLLRSQGHGHVLNVASAAGLLSGPMMGAYNVAKAGVIALSETLNAELVGSKVKVTVLCPMFFQTNIAKSGRTADQKVRAAFEGLVTRGPTAQVVARAAIASVERGDLYAVPMAGGLWLWRLKRIAPRAFGKLSGHLGKRALR